MENTLLIFIVLPLLGFLASTVWPKLHEKAISSSAIYTIGFHLLGGLVFTIYWLYQGRQPLLSSPVMLYSTKNLTFSLDFYFDGISAVYMLVGSLLCFLVGLFSRYYMHREPGFKRYFSTLTFFFLGYNAIILSGNFETLLIGWEIIGITSFILISFYRDRFLPVKNGFKVLSFYRLSDIMLIMALWSSHQLFHNNVNFMQLNDSAFIASHESTALITSVLIPIMFLLAASVKSAQFPFSSWLPRAMEGPTSSSAIFYGSLAVHIGVFLLLRTYPLWQDLIYVRVLIVLCGLTTAIVASTIARVQSTVKTQVGYASIAQIGLMFIEVGLGWHGLALVHFAGNAFLRSYQLLVSPSVLGYLIHDMFFHYEPENTGKPLRFRKWRNTFYMLAVKEFNLDSAMYHLLWRPFKWIGSRMKVLRTPIGLTLLIGAILVGLTGFFIEAYLSPATRYIITSVLAIISFLVVLTAFTERGQSTRAWLYVFVAQLLLLVSVAFNDHFTPEQIGIYLSGTVGSMLLGYISLRKIRTIENDIDLNEFHGHIYEHPRLGLLFFLSALGLAGFPITPAYLGVDIMFSHIRGSQVFLLTFTALSFLFMELAIIRIYARVFLGQHIKTYHETAFKSS